MPANGLPIVKKTRGGKKIASNNLILFIIPFKVFYVTIAVIEKKSTNGKSYTLNSNYKLY